MTSEPFPPVVYEGSHIVLSCSVSKGSHLSYTWFFNRREVTSSTSPLLHLTGNKLVMENVTPEHAGWYYCMAWSTVQDIRRFSSSFEFQVTVKGVYQQKNTCLKCWLDLFHMYLPIFPPLYSSTSLRFQAKNLFLNLERGSQSQCKCDLLVNKRKSSSQHLSFNR